MSISVSGNGDYTDTKSALNAMLQTPSAGSLDRWGQEGVDALSKATPEDTGLTSESWGYRITSSNFGPVIEWYNSNLDDQGTQIAILIQYGHGTGTGGYIQGKDYINPAITEVFDNIIAQIGGE